MRLFFRFARHGPLLALVFLLPLAFACAGEDTAPVVDSGKGVSSHGYALLHGILEQEKKVSQLLIIKQDREALGKVIDEIAETCRAASKRLEALAENSPILDLSDHGLPVIEVQTREAIAAMRREILLASSGRELELQLLLTQVEALTYASNLADMLSRSEPDPERLAFVRSLWNELRDRLSDVQLLLRSPIQANG